MGASEWVHVAVEEIVRATEKALLLRLPDGREVWVPASQVADEQDYEVGDRNLTVSVKAWFAGKEGLEG